MEYVVRADLCARVGIRLTDLLFHSGPEEFRICGHMEAGPDYRGCPGVEPAVVVDLLDAAGRVLGSMRAWHQGLFSRLGFSTFCLSTKGLDTLWGRGAVCRVSLYVVLEEAEQGPVPSSRVE